MGCIANYTYNFTAKNHYYEYWHTSNAVYGFENLFENSDDNPNVEFWDVAKAISFNGMFKNAKNF